MAGKIAGPGEVEVLGRDRVWAALGCCELTLNFKLHASVLSAVAGVPFVALGYRFKVFDFAASLGLEDLVVPTDAPDLSRDLLDKVAGLGRRQGEVAAGMGRGREMYAGRLRAPFARGVF